ncbi:MAG: hypothetical protein CL582_23475 [Alteromonadaceae bacterium]|nr:hypothetical protein [Alteromonadaceae bacterium]
MNALEKYAAKKKLIHLVKIAGAQRLARIRAAVTKRGWGRRDEGLVEAGDRASRKVSRRHKNVEQELQLDEKMREENPALARLLDLGSPKKRRLPEGMDRSFVRMLVGK